MSLTWLLYNLHLDDVIGADFENSLPCTLSANQKRDSELNVLYVIKLYITKTTARSGEFAGGVGKLFINLCGLFGRQFFRVARLARTSKGPFNQKF